MRPFFARFCATAVASVGLAVNYRLYSACDLLSPRFSGTVTLALMPVYVAARARPAIAVTFLGFRPFAFPR